MENLVRDLGAVYSGRRVLVTGHNGFKGTWLVALLNLLGAEVHGVSLDIDSNSPFADFHRNGVHKSYIQDIRDYSGLQALVKDVNPEIVFHLAAQALVLDSYERPLETFEVNVQGTANLLESIIPTNPAGVIVVTTDKVYRNDNSGKAFRENDVLWGHDPYSLSKVGTELVVSAWRVHPHLDFSKLVTVRGGNVVGPGDRSRNRLMPDLIRASQSGGQFLLRNPNSVRPWQYVLDPIIGYLSVGRLILLGVETSPAYNFGPRHNSCVSVGEFVDIFQSHLPLQIRYSEEVSEKESELLFLDSSLAAQELGWVSRTDLNDAVIQTISLENSKFKTEQIYSHLSEYLAKIS